MRAILRKIKFTYTSKTSSAWVANFGIGLMFRGFFIGLAFTRYPITLSLVFGGYSVGFWVTDGET